MLARRFRQVAGFLAGHIEKNISGPEVYPTAKLDWWNDSGKVVKERYKAFANTYEKWVTGSQQDSILPGYVGHIKCAETLNTAATEIYGDKKKTLRVLDLGCGTGLVGEILNEKFKFNNLVGLDASEDMLEKAKEKGIYSKLICSYVASERVVDIENAEFDAVVASGVILPGLVLPNAFDEIIRWVKLGGIIYFNCRSDGYDSEEYGYKNKFENLGIQKRWKLISNTDSDYYGDQPPPGHASTRSRLLVYRILPF